MVPAALAPLPRATAVVVALLGVQLAMIEVTSLVTLYSWLPFTASVEVALITPAATFVIFCGELVP